MPPSEASKSNHVPKVMGGLEEEYEILSELGRGGTAVVYLAQDRSLGRKVAVKVIRATYVEDEEAVARLVREARTVAQLQHPNIVMLYGTRRLDDNSLALIMQYVPGRPLKAVIRNDGPLPFKMVQAVLDDIGSALSYAHRQKIVHRDIKPENIYLDEGVEVARLADFGIARHWDNDAGITLPGMAIGTPTYMSPEQIDGAQLDGRSDIYSLGIVGYEMLTGQQPWAGENLYSIIYKQKREQLPTLDQVRPGVPENLQRAVEGALEKRPDDRWQSPEAFLAQLRGLVGADAEETEEDPAERDTVVVEKAPPRRSGQVPLVPVVDDEALTIRYRRPTDEELEAEFRTEDEPEDAGAYEEDEDEAFDELGLPIAPPLPARAPSSARRTAILALLAIVSGAVGYIAFQTGMGGELWPGQGPEQVDVDPIPGVPTGGAGTQSVALKLPATLERVDPDPIMGAAGETVADPIRVRVLDQEGAPVAAALVNFQVSSGGGQISDPSVETDGAGVAMATWVLGTGSGVDRVVVRTPGVSDVEPLTIEAMRRSMTTGMSGFPEGGPAMAGSVTETDSSMLPDLPPVAGLLSLVSGGGQRTAPGSAIDRPIRVQVLGPDGEPAPGVAVIFEPDADHGVVDLPMVETDAQGFAETGWTLGSGSGPMRMEVRLAGGDLVTVAEATAAAAPRGIPARALLASGGTHTCATTSAGALSCWGANGDGQLGDGARTSHSRPSGVSGGFSFARLAAGISSTCGISTDGDTYCWGRNDAGQLGIGSGASRATPASVAGGRRFTGIHVGLSHACARTGVGEAFCWGLNTDGQLGDGSQNNRSIPVEVGGGRRFSSLTAGWNHTCGRSGDRTYCWGSNASGQLGSGGSAGRLQPTPVAVTFGFTQVDAGGNHTCGVATSGIAYCWGDNRQGQLGDGSGENQNAPVPVSAETAFAQVSAGPLHTCALSGAGAAYCWGRNNRGQLGDGTATDRPMPTAVEGGLTFSTLTVGGNHTCGRASDGVTYCWGFNSDGQLGDGSRQNRNRPTRVGG
ncbi:MAG: protein kinase domain-containing protein [Longimicrobiales bacterium]